MVINIRNFAEILYKEKENIKIPMRRFVLGCHNKKEGIKSQSLLSNMIQPLRNNRQHMRIQKGIINSFPVPAVFH